jgi:hypothetical protein
MQPFVICPKCQQLDARRTLCQCGYGESSPLKEKVKEKGSFGQQPWPRRAAGYSAKFPLGALFAVYLTDAFLRRDVFTGNTLGLFAMIALQAVLLLGGVGFGIASLWGLARYGGEGILGRALFGLALSLGIIAWLAWGFFLGISR